MSCQLLTLLFLASFAQEKKDWRPVPRPPVRSQIINVRVKAPGSPEIRQLKLSMPAPDNDDEEAVARLDVRFNIQSAVVDPENFDLWIFADDQSEADRHRHLDEILQSKVKSAAMTYHLTDSQRAKLRLAGRGDIKHFFDHVEDRRRNFEADRHNFKTGFAALERLDSLTEIYREGVFGAGSLFAKTLARINDDLKAVQY